jgi:hypothetical protein
MSVLQESLKIITGFLYTIQHSLFIIFSQNIRADTRRRGERTCSVRTSFDGRGQNVSILLQFALSVGVAQFYRTDR